MMSSERQGLSALAARPGNECVGQDERPRWHQTLQQVLFWAGGKVDRQKIVAFVSTGAIDEERVSGSRVGLELQL